MKIPTFHRIPLFALVGLASPGLLTPLHAQAPMLTGTTPPAQAIGVPTSTTVAASFSQPLGSNSRGALSVFSQQAGGRKAGTGSVSGNTITFAPTTAFRAGETVWATLTATVRSTNLVALTKPTVWQFTTATRPSAGTFGGSQEVALGGLLTSVSLGDVDGDGDLDMLTTQNGKLTILANNGQGTFEDKGLAALNFNEPVPILGQTLADLDGDGDLDVIIRGSGATGAGALDLGFNDGHGTFTGGNGRMLSLDVVPRELTVGDVDGNGLLDLLVATSSGKVKVYLNYGLPQITLTSLPDLSVDAVPTTLTLGDVDNDGDLDLVTGKADNTVLISYNDGSGSFSSNSTVSSNNPSQVVLGDVDRDGDLDLVVANGLGRSGSTVSIHLNAGQGTFGTATTLGVSAAPLSLALGDVDGDGDLDLVTANYDNSTASVRLNNGQGNFGNGREVAVGSGPVQVVLGDVDGDGTLDLATANQTSSTASVRLNQATATTTPGAWYTLIPTAGQVIPREETAYVAAGDQFYLLGGRSIMPVQAYAPKQQTWTNKVAPPIELHHFQAVELNGLLYAAGAFTGGYPHEQPVSQVYLYNPVADQWLTGATIPAARRRGSAGAVAYNGKLYLVGGITDGHWAGWVPWFDEYDPATNTWKTLPDAPRARDHFQAALRQGKLYLVGGRRSSASTGEVFNLTIPEVDVFDFATGQWSTLPSTANLPTPRAGAGTAFLGDELVVIGGESAQPTAHQETEALDVTRNTWRRLANLQQGRHGIQAIANNGGLYVVAGAGNQGGSPLLGSQEAYYPGALTTPTGAALIASSLVAPTTVSFNSATNSSDATQLITLRNSGGNQDILLTAVDLSGAGAAAFRYQLPYPLPFVLPAGQSISMQISYSPTAGSQSATLRLGHSGAGGATTLSLVGSSQGSSASALRLRAGGGALSTTLGTFAADQYYAPTPGATYTTTATIAGTQNQALYQTERYSPNGVLAYAIPVPSGQYTVVLHFAEIYWQQAGQRLFDVSLEGQKVLDNYDIVQKVGPFTATTESFAVSVTDGVLNVDLSSLASDGGRDQAKISAIEVLPTTPTSSLPTSYRLRAGGGALTTTQGVFAADQGYAPTPGNTYSTTAAIGGTNDPALYQTERYGTNGQFRYSLPLANGTYTVVLHFAEIYWQQAGQRLFDVSLEGQKVLDNYDIVQKAGPFTATTETFTTTVTDGTLNLDFSSLASDGGRDQAKLSALEVRPLGSSATTARTLAAAAAPMLAPTGGTWEVYPNPASEQVTLNFPSAKSQLATVVLTDALGRTVLRREMQVPSGSTSLPLPLTQISEGLYQLTLYLADGQRWQQKLMVHP